MLYYFRSIVIIKGRLLVKQTDWEGIMSRRFVWPTCLIVISFALTLGSATHAQHGISWFAQYFNNHEFSLDKSKGHDGHFQQEGGLNFNWGKGAPPSHQNKIPADGFSVRFLADNVHFDEGNYRFEIRADDYFVFFVDEQARFDSRGSSPGTTHNIDVALSAGTHNLKVEYYEFSEDAYIHLNWQRLDGAGSSPSAPAPAAAPTPYVYYARPVAPQDARSDGSIVHVVQAGDTVNSIALAYRIDPSVIVERNLLEGGGRWIYPGQELVIREATALSGGTSTLTPVESADEDDVSTAADSEAMATDGETDRADDPSGTIIFTDSSEELLPVEIDSTCLETLRGEHDTDYDESNVVQLARFAVPDLNIRGLIPNEWEGDPLGVVTRGNLIQDPTALIHQVAPAMNFNEFVREILPQFGFSIDLPPAACIQQLSTTDFWLLYVLPPTQMLFVGEVTQVLALLERDGMSMISMMARPEEFVPLLETAFLPAVWNYEYGGP